MPRPKVLALLTGGTIASSVDACGTASPDAKNTSSIQEKLKRFFESRGVDVLVSYPCGQEGIDSSDMDIAAWCGMTRTVCSFFESSERGEEIAGVLISHGTDTMAYTAAWLSICFPHAPCPVVLTGSSLTADELPEDGTNNLLGAARTILSGRCGVFVYFDWKLFEGGRVHKGDASAIGCFEAAGSPAIDFREAFSRAIEPARDVFSRDGFSELEAVLEAGERHRLADDLSWFFCTPGGVPHFQGSERAIGVVGYGAGNFSGKTREAIREAFVGRRDKPVVLACSQAERGTKNPGAYDAGIMCLKQDGFRVFSQKERPLEFMHALACYALLASSGERNPEKRSEILEAILSRYLKEE